MIALLTGQIAYKSPDHLIVDVQGVGYRVMIPFSPTMNCRRRERSRCTSTPVCGRMLFSCTAFEPVRKKVFSNC